MKVDRVYYDVPTEEVTVKRANRKLNKNVGKIDVINVDTAVDVKSRSSAKAVKYLFKRPVEAVVENKNGKRKLVVRDY